MRRCADVARLDVFEARNPASAAMFERLQPVIDAAGDAFVRQYGRRPTLLVLPDADTIRGKVTFAGLDVRFSPAADKPVLL